MNPTTITTDLRRRLAELTKSRWARQTHDHPTTETTR